MSLSKKVLVQEFMEWCRLNELPNAYDKLDAGGCFEDGIYQLFIDGHPKYCEEGSSLADYLKKGMCKYSKRKVKVQKG